MKKEFEHFFEVSLDMLCIADKNGYFRILNPAFTATLGHSMEELLSRPFIDFVHPDDIRSTLAEVERLRQGLPTINFENRYRCKDGSYKWLSWYSMPHPDGHLYAVARDITKIKEEQKSLTKIVEDLKRSNEELEQFAYIASHDLQEPLRKITNFSGLFLEKYSGQLDDVGKKYVDYMVDGAKRMSQLINDLLLYSRVGRENVPLEEIDLNELVQKVLEDFRDTPVKFDAIMDGKNFPRIVSYRAQMVQLFSNLMSNAVKFHQTQPLAISIDVEKTDDGFYHFQFRDNGIGIESQYHQQIFGMFRRLHSRGIFPGTGIGLSICKKIVEHHGGKIWVESEPGKGSTFHFLIQNLSQTPYFSKKNTTH